MKVFVNTLARFADRRARMQSSLESLKIPFEWFEGPDGKELRPDELVAACDLEKIKKNLDRAMSLNEIGCTMGQRAIYKKRLFAESCG